MANRIDHVKTKLPYTRRQAFLASVYMSLLLNVVIILGLVYGRSHIHMIWKDYGIFFFWNLCSNIILFYFLFLFNFRAIKRKRHNERRTIAYVFLGTLLICIVASPVISELQWIVMGADNEVGYWTFSTFNLIKDIIVGIIVILLSSMMNLYLKREQTIYANQKLMQENIRIKYESLKNQLDPHFLFNSLNTLNGLVGMDDEKAHEYIDNLSSVFRYTLHSKIICTLEQEMEFVEAYFALLKIRYGDNLRLINNIELAYNGYFIIPVSIQLLVENAVKHNVISNSEPLTITIASPDGSLRVSNHINPKVDKVHGGVGLANLTERYSILFGKTVEIRESGGEFSVTIPLIKEYPYESAYNRR